LIWGALLGRCWPCQTSQLAKQHKHNTSANQAAAPWPSPLDCLRATALSRCHHTITVKPAAVCWVLGIEREQLPGALCSKCQAINTAVHARRCVNTGLPTLRHHLLSKRIASGLRSMCLLGVQMEQCAPFAASDEPERRMDITVEGGQGLSTAATDRAADDSHKTALLDITVTDPTISTALAGACKTRCHAAETAALKKHRHYERHIDNTRYTLVPAAMEVFGGACTEWHSFIDAVACWRVGGSSGTWAKSSIIDWWRRRVSFALQAGTSTIVDIALRRSRPSTGYALHTTVALLRVPTMAATPTATAAAAAATAATDAAVHRTLA
jgi:hypothetical protein